MTAFAVTTAIAQYYPALWLPLTVCALSIAASRILLGMHFLTDVLAGSLMGAWLGHTASALLR